VKLLVDFRLHKDVVHIARPHGYEQNPEKYELRAHLITFRRNDTSMVDNTNLYISYETSFENFLTIFRDASQLSVIRFSPIPPKQRRESSLSIAQLLSTIDYTPNVQHQTMKEQSKEELQQGNRNPLRYQQESLRLDLDKSHIPVNEAMYVFLWELKILS